MLTLRLNSESLDSLLQSLTQLSESESCPPTTRGRGRRGKETIDEKKKLNLDQRTVRVVSADHALIFSRKRLEQGRQLQEPWILCRLSLPQFCAIHPRAPTRGWRIVSRKQEEVHIIVWHGVTFAVHFRETDAGAARCKAQAVRLHCFLEPRPESARFMYDFVVVAIEYARTVSFGAYTAAAVAAWTARLVVGIVCQVLQRVDAVVYPEQAQSQALVLAFELEETRVQEYLRHQRQTVDGGHACRLTRSHHTRLKCVKLTKKCSR